MPIRKWLYSEDPNQIAHNMQDGQKPDSMSWADWCDYDRPNYWGRECHMYDDKLAPETVTKKTNGGHCRGDLYHDHSPRIMTWYWASPWGVVVPAVWELWQFRGYILSEWLERLGWYRLLEKFGVDTSPSDGRNNDPLTRRS